jgi:hypothetical protein
LLAGWQAALQHPLDHVDELGEFVHLQGGDSSDESSFCDALAALTACAPDAAQSPVASEQFEQFLGSLHQSAPRVADAPPFLSQGPPAAPI